MGTKKRLKAFRGVEGVGTGLKKVKGLVKEPIDTDSSVVVARGKEG